MSISQILNSRGYQDMSSQEQPPFPAAGLQQPQQQQAIQPPPPPPPAQTSGRQSGAAKQIHRNRAQHICHSCRRRKVKCDRQHPVCGGCQKMGVPCEWSDNSQILGKEEGGRKGSITSIQQSPPRNSNKNHHQHSIQHAGDAQMQYAPGSMLPPAFGPPIHQSPVQKRGHKRQRTHPDATISEESDSFSDDQRFDVARHSFGRDSMPFLPGGVMRNNVAPSAPSAPSTYETPRPQGIEGQLEARLGKLAEIVDKWCRDTYLANGAPAPDGLSHDNLRQDLLDLQAITARRGSSSMDSTAGGAPSTRPQWEDSQSSYTSYRQNIELPGGLRSPSTSAMDTSESVTHAEDLPMSPFTDPPALPEHIDNSLEIPGQGKIPPNWQQRRDKGMQEITSFFDPGVRDARSIDDVIDPQITAQSPTTPKAKRGPGRKAQGLPPTAITDAPPGRPEDDDLSLGHLSIQEDGRTRYVGSTFWAFISNEISELNQVLQTQPDEPGRPRTVNMMDDHQCTQHEQPVQEQPANKQASNAVFTPPYSETSKPSPEDPIQHPQNPRHEMARILAAMDEEETDHRRPIIPKQDLSIFKILPEDSSMCAAAKLQQGFAPEHQARQMVWFLKYLPLENQSHALYTAFLAGVHPVVPLLHAPSFNKDYAAFWKMKNEENVENFHFSPTFIPLLFAVLYTGALSISGRKFKEAFPAEEHTPKTVTSHLHKTALASLAVTAFPRGPTLSSLIAYLLIHTCKIREEEPLTSYAFVGVAMRAAQSAGLHREPSSFKGLNEVEREVRRRIWWHIVYLDVQAAIATGLPPLGGSDESAFDTQMVSELKDEYIGAPSPVTADDIKKDEAAVKSACTGIPNSLLGTRSSSAMIAAVGRYEATRVLRKLVASLFSVKVPQKQDVSTMGKIIYDLQMKIDERINRIPARGIPEMGFVPPGTPDEETSTEAEKLENFNGWARTMLSLMYDKCFSVLYQPFLRTILSQQWRYARQCSLHACHRLLRKFLFLSTSPAFRPYFWFLPGTYQPLHSCMILLLDIYNLPKSDEAAASKQLLNQVFDLFGTDGNGDPNSTTGSYEALTQRPLVEGGKEAWAMMARFRAKAYARGSCVAAKLDFPNAAIAAAAIASSERVGPGAVAATGGSAGGGHSEQQPNSGTRDSPGDKIDGIGGPACEKPPDVPDNRRVGITAEEVDEIIERSIRRPPPNARSLQQTQQMVTDAYDAHLQQRVHHHHQQGQQEGSQQTNQNNNSGVSNSGGNNATETPVPSAAAPPPGSPHDSRSNLDYSIVDDLPIFSGMNNPAVTGAASHGFNEAYYGNNAQSGSGGGYLPQHQHGGMSYETAGYYPQGIGGITLDAAGFPVILAPGVMYNMETGQAQVQYEDHGANFEFDPSSGSHSNNTDNNASSNGQSSSGNNGGGNNDDVFMDMSGGNIDWSVWDRTFGTYASVSSDASQHASSIGHSFQFPEPDQFSRENHFV